MKRTNVVRRIAAKEATTGAINSTVAAFGSLGLLPLAGAWSPRIGACRGPSADRFNRSPRLHDRQISVLGALEDATHIDAGLTIRIPNVGSIAHQPAGFRILTHVIRR